MQNEKGLPVNFQIIGTQVGNQPETPSLTVDFGNIAPGQTADASFLLLSSLQGVFEDFTATFSHSERLGGTADQPDQQRPDAHADPRRQFRLSRTAPAQRITWSTTSPNPQSLPDTIYFSDGTTAPVNIATNATSSPVGPSGQLTFQVTANVTSGWDYIQVPDPGAGYTLYKVVRSDGTVIPVSDQAWTTDRTISPTGKATVDYELHILDDNSTGSYLVYYRPTSATAPAVAYRAPAGKHTAWAYCHVPNGSPVDMTARIESQVERFAPGFRDLVLARSAMGPAAMEAHDPNYVGGDINGGVADLRQLFTRPVARVSPLLDPAAGRVPLLLVDPARRGCARHVRLPCRPGGAAVAEAARSGPLAGPISREQDTADAPPGRLTSISHRALRSLPSGSGFLSGRTERPDQRSPDVHSRLRRPQRRARRGRPSPALATVMCLPLLAARPEPVEEPARVGAAEARGLVGRPRAIAGARLRNSARPSLRTVRPSPSTASKPYSPSASSQIRAVTRRRRGRREPRTGPPGGRHWTGRSPPPRRSRAT